MASSWFSAGRLTNPAAGAVLADTGPFSTGVGSLAVQAVVSSTVLAQVLLQHRDVANTTTLSEQLFVVPANSTYNLPLESALQGLQAGERFRLVLNAGITGTIQGSLIL